MGFTTNVSPLADPCGFCQLILLRFSPGEDAALVGIEPVLWWLMLMF